MSAIEGLGSGMSYRGVSADDQIGKVTLIGAGMKSNPGIAAKMFRTLAAEGINIQMIDTSTIRITVTIDRLSDTDTIINYGVSGSATASDDYTALSGSVTILANTASAVIDLSVSDDALLEDDETVTVFIVLDEDIYETALGDGEFHYFNPETGELTSHE